MIASDSGIRYNNQISNKKILKTGMVLLTLATSLIVGIYFVATNQGKTSQIFMVYAKEFLTALIFQVILPAIAYGTNRDLRKYVWREIRDGVQNLIE